MSARRVSEARHYFRSLRSAGVQARSPLLQGLKAAVRALASAEVLPGPLDYETLIPPVQRAWVRRIPGQNLWLFYRVREDVLYLLFVTRDPPVPIA